MRKILALSVILATLGLATVFALTARWSWAVLIAAIGLFWLTLPWHGFGWAATVGFLSFTAAAALGVLLSLSPFWLLSSLIAALVAWDLGHFSDQLYNGANIRNEAAMARRHFQRLGLVAVLGWVLGLVALRVEFSFDFVWALALGLLVILSLSRVTRGLGSENDESGS